MKYPALLLTCLFLYSLKAQETIPISNPSFEEDAPDCGKIPSGWIRRNESDMGGPSGQPGCFEVSTPAFHGRQYLSLLIRRNEEGDRIGQKLPEKTWLQMDSTYRIRLNLAWSDAVEIPKANGKKFIAYKQPAQLLLWGYNTQLRRAENLATTPVIDHTDWRGYDLVFRPLDGSYDEIWLEAWQDDSRILTQYGNILIDSISAIVKSTYPGLVNGRPGAELSLTNPSFEDAPKCCDAPNGWYDCGPSDESPPDVQPGIFQVTKTAQQGDTYLGLVVRDNETWESVGQRLPVPLEIDHAYLLIAYLARAEMLLSISRATGDESNYATPVKLRVWGGSGYCDRQELLAESPLISNTRWLEYQLVLTPKKSSYLYLTLEAYYKTPITLAYNGNLLIDNISLFQTYNK